LSGICTRESTPSALAAGDRSPIAPPVRNTVFTALKAERASEREQWTKSKRERETARETKRVCVCVHAAERERRERRERDRERKR